MLAACAATPVLEGEFIEDAGAARRRLLVVNDASFPVTIVVNGKTAGNVPARSTAEIDVGRSAGPQTSLVATGAGMRVEQTVSGRPWRAIWVLRGRS